MNYKEFMTFMIFQEFNIQPEYILEEKEENNIVTYQLKDEENTEATLTINYNTNEYTINCEDYKEEKEFVLID